MMKARIKNALLSVAAGSMVVVLAVSCGNTPPAGELDSLIAKRDSLRLVKDDIDQKITHLETIIAELDTSADRKLVTVYYPERNIFRHYFEVYGNVQSDQAASIFPENPGVVQKIEVREGQEVTKGQVIMRLDAEVLRRNLAELQTSYELANTLFEKQERLWDQNIGSEVQFLEAKNRKESLENSISTLEEQVNKTVIRAPFAGVVDKIFPKTGEMASSQMPVARLVNTTNLYVTADVSERYLGKVKKGDEVSVIINRRDTLITQIARVGSYINPNNRSFEVRVEVPEGEVNIMPNSLVVLKINDYTVEDAIAIPSSLIMQDGVGVDYVFVAEQLSEGRLVARKRSVESGTRYLGKTLIYQGIDESLPIIDKGSRGLRDGDRIAKINI